MSSSLVFCDLGCWHGQGEQGQKVTLRRTRLLVAGFGELFLSFTVVPMRLLILEGGGRLMTTARRICLQACHTWYPLIMHLHRYFIAVARIAVNHDPGYGTALTLLFGLLVLWLKRQRCRKPCAVLLLRPVLRAFWLDLYSYPMLSSLPFLARFTGLLERCLVY